MDKMWRCFGLFILYIFAVHTFVAAQSYPFNVKIGEDCDDEMKDLINKALIEVISLLEVTVTRLGKLDTRLRTSKASAGSLTEYRDGKLIARTFENIMDREHEDTPADRHIYIQRVANRASLARNMISFLNPNEGTGFVDNSPEIRCSFSWLLPTTTAGRSKDARPDISRDVPAEIVPFPPPPRRTLQSWVFSPTTPPHDFVIVLNTAFKATWASKGQSGTLYQMDDVAHRQMSYVKMRSWSTIRLTKTRWWLYQLLDSHLSATLLGALSQSRAVTKGSALVDQPCHQTYVPHPASTWPCVIKLAKNWTGASKSPLNFVYLVVALYLEPWDWSSGYNRIPSSTYMLPENGNVDHPHPSTQTVEDDYSSQHAAIPSDQLIEDNDELEAATRSILGLTGSEGPKWKGKGRAALDEAYLPHQSTAQSSTFADTGYTLDPYPESERFAFPDKEEAEALSLEGKDQEYQPGSKRPFDAAEDDLYEDDRNTQAEVSHTQGTDQRSGQYTGPRLGQSSGVSSTVPVPAGDSDLYGNTTNEEDPELPSNAMRDSDQLYESEFPFGDIPDPQAPYSDNSPEPPEPADQGES